MKASHFPPLHYTHTKTHILHREIARNSHVWIKFINGT